MARRAERGNAVIEMTLIGIPIIFVLISIFEISRGMWAYHTLAHSVREGTRFAIVRGQNCAPPRTCGTTVEGVVTVVRQSGIGLTPPDLTITLVSGTTTFTCNSGNNYCAGNTATFPVPPTNAVGNPLTITAVYDFRSALAMLWPGVGSVQFGRFSFPSSSTEMIQF